MLLSTYGRRVPLEIRGEGNEACVSPPCLEVLLLAQPAAARSGHLSSPTASNQSHSTQQSSAGDLRRPGCQSPSNNVTISGEVHPPWTLGDRAHWSSQATTGCYRQAHVLSPWASSPMTYSPDRPCTLGRRNGPAAGPGRSHVIRVGTVPHAVSARQARLTGYSAASRPWTERRYRSGAAGPKFDGDTAALGGGGGREGTCGAILPRSSCARSVRLRGPPCFRSPSWRVGATIGYAVMVLFCPPPPLCCYSLHNPLPLAVLLPSPSYGIQVVLGSKLSNWLPMGLPCVYPLVARPLMFPLCCNQENGGNKKRRKSRNQQRSLARSLTAP